MAIHRQLWKLPCDFRGVPQRGVESKLATTFRVESLAIAKAGTELVARGCSGGVNLLRSSLGGRHGKQIGVFQAVLPRQHDQPSSRVLGPEEAKFPDGPELRLATIGFPV